MQMKKIIILLIIIEFSYNLTGQQYNFRNFSLDKGLPKSTIYSIIQDTRGYLWLGTDGGGICRFDGKTFTTYDTKTGLVGNTVRCILEDNKGNIWIGTDDGISVYNGKNFFNIDTSYNLPEAPIYDIYEDSRNNIWIGSAGGGLYKVELITDDSAKIWFFNKTKDDFTTNYIFGIYELDQQLYLALYGGINIATISNDTSISDLYQLDADYDQIPSNYILAVCPDKDGNLWFGTHDVGVFKIIMKGSNKGDIISYYTHNGFNDNTVWDIIQDSKGDLWFATDKNGLIRKTSEGFKYYTSENGLAGNQVLSLCEDTEKSIWAGTFGSGISQYMGDHFIHLTEKDGLLSDKILGIEQDKNGNVWLASEDEGLIKVTFNNNKPVFKYYTTNNGLLSNYTTSISIAPDEKIWIGTLEGVSVFDGKKFKNYDKNFNSILANSVWTIYVDSRGGAWCGTSQGLLWIKGDYQYVHKEDEEGYFLFNQFKAITEDKDSSIWFGTTGGILNWGENLVYYDEMEGLTHTEVHCITPDTYGNIWIGTFGGGLYKYSANSADSLPFKQIADDKILSSNNVYSIVFLYDSVLIVGTDKGFDKLVLDKNQNINSIFNYDETNGFIGIENNLNSIFKDNENNIWFGTVKGLTKYNAKLEKQMLPPPNTHITDIDLFYKPVHWIEKTGNKIPFFNLPQEMLLKHKENHLTFKYSGIYFTNPEKVTYKYILDGLEEEWSPLREDGKVTYPGLAHGNYIFKVMAFNDRGETADNPATFSFVIKPPFWRTKWFIALCIVVLTALIIFYIKHREKVLQEENRILEEKVRERTTQIRKQNEEIAHQKEHIEHLYKEVTDSIQYAEKIQTAILPSDEMAKEVLKDYFILFKPIDIVIGDFYWLTHIGDLNIFTAADCTGHGVPGAFMSLLGVSFLNDIVNKRGIVESNEILNELRKYIIASFQQEKETTERKEGMDIAISILDRNTNNLQFSGAYNPLYLVRPKKGKDELKVISAGEEKILEPAMENEKYNLFEIKADKMPAAIYLKMTSFTKHEIQLQKNDRIYMFSDGFADQFGGPNAKKYMSKAFKRFFLSIQDQSMEKQKESLDNENKNWKKHINPSSGEEFSQIDDIVIIGVKI